MKVALVTVLMFATNFANAQNHDHHSAPTKKSEMHQTSTQTSTQKFKPTDDLKVRMEKVLSLMKELQGKKTDSKAVAEYGTKLTSAVNDIFKTCKLEPAADSAIHPSLALILKGAADLKKGKYESGHAKIHEGLLDYEKQFTHDGWNH